MDFGKSAANVKALGKKFAKTTGGLRTYEQTFRQILNVP